MPASNPASTDTAAKASAPATVAAAAKPVNGASGETVEQPPSESAAPVAPSPRLYVGNLPVSVNAAAIRELVPDLGKVKVHIGRVRRNRLPPKSAYAFLSFESTEQATSALKLLEGKVYDEFTLKASFAEPEPPKKPKAAKPKAEKAAATATEEPATAAAAAESETTNGKAKAKAPKAPAGRPAKRVLPLSSDTVYVSNIGLETTEDEVREIFAKFKGAEVTIVHKPGARAWVRGRFMTAGPRRFAFVNVGDGAQERAIEELNGKAFKDSTLVVKKATVPPPTDEAKAGEPEPEEEA